MGSKPLGRCNYTWYPPKLYPPQQPGAEPYQGFGPEETCYLKLGHEGEHRSLGKVTAPNNKNKVPPNGS